MCHAAGPRESREKPVPEETAQGVLVKVMLHLGVG